MTKNNKIVLAVLAVVLVIAVAFTALTGNEAFLQKITGSIDTASGESLESLSPVSFGTSYPLVQTEQKDLFYEMYPDGKFVFYTLADGQFSEASGVKTKDITLTCSYQKLKIKLYYLSTDAGTVGYGLFNSRQEKDGKLFSYVFVRMMDCPKAYSKTARTSHILLADMDAADAYKPEKTYSDMYSFDLKSGKASLVVSQRDRLVDNDGTMREDWTVFTDSMLNVGEKYDIFASRRNYDTKDTAVVKYDLLTVANSRSAKKNSATTVTNSPSYVVREKDGAYYCFANTDNGFDLIRNGDKKNPLASFEGSFTDYAVSGNYLLNKASFEVTDITSGEKVQLKKATFTELSGFIANAEGTRFALFCNADVQSMILYNTENGETKIITDNIFSNGICNFCFVDNGTVLFSAYDEAGAAVNRIIKF